MKQNRLKAIIKEHYPALSVMLLILIFSIIAMKKLGVQYTLYSDDFSYVLAGIEFANSETVTMNNSISALVMPGMPFFIGLFSLAFGEGIELWIALKIAWIIMGAMTSWFVYKSVRIFAPRWCAAAAMCLLMSPDFIWGNNLILTETPFMLMLSIMIYETFMMAKDKKWKHFIWGTAAFFCALMLKANIGLYPLFALFYLIIKKYPIKKLLLQSLVLLMVLCSFIVPWSIRNNKIYDAFIPLTFGSGNPELLGTYQGYGYPDDNLDYETYVNKPMQEVLKKYEKADGAIEPQVKWYTDQIRDSLKAEYRKSVWWNTNPKSMLISYLIIKPRNMIFNNVFCWKELFFNANQFTFKIRYIELSVIFLGILIALANRKFRKEYLFLIILYIVNIYLYASTYSFDRYAQPFLIIRFIMFGISLYGIKMLLLQTGKEYVKTDGLSHKKN